MHPTRLLRPLVLAFAIFAPVVRGDGVAAAPSQLIASPRPTAVLPRYPYAFPAFYDIEYKRVGGQSLRLDFSLPDGPGPFPVAILVHGGGWVSGDKESYGCTPLFTPLHRAGFAWFSINYRLASMVSPRGRYPACIEDVEAAIRWVKAYAAADRRLDGRRIALIGESAGGHLVDEAAVRARADTRVAAVVSFYAPCDLVSDTRRRGALSKSMVALFGLHSFDPAAEQVLRAASPLNFVNSDLPPFLLLHGTADTTVPYVQSVQWQASLNSLGVRCDLISIPGAPHGMARWDTYDPGYRAQVIAWLARTLGVSRVRATAAAPVPGLLPLAGL